MAKSAFTITILLLICFSLDAAISINKNKEANIKDLQWEPDTVLVYNNGSCFYATIVGISNKKVVVAFLVSQDAPQKIRYPQKYIFKICQPHTCPVPKFVRFRYFDETLTDDVIVKGKIIGYNKEYFLLEHAYNQQPQIVVKHRSEILSKDLRK